MVGATGTFWVVIRPSESTPRGRLGLESRHWVSTVVLTTMCVLCLIVQIERLASQIGGC
jgi:hypothetical protein